jgi:DNA-binding transcriptional ArsR family regulator
LIRYLWKYQNKAEVAMQPHQVIAALAALAQEHRLAAFRALVEAGPEGLAAGVIADRVGIPSSTLSFHLAQLCHAGLVSQRRVGRSLIYSADFATMAGLMAYLTENCCGTGVVCAAPACDPKAMASTIERKAS